MTPSTGSKKRSTFRVLLLINTISEEIRETQESTPATFPKASSYHKKVPSRSTCERITTRAQNISSFQSFFQLPYRFPSILTERLVTKSLNTRSAIGSRHHNLRNRIPHIFLS